MPWAKEAIENEFKNDKALYVVAEQEGQLLGYGGMWCILDEGEITTIAVAPSARRAGIGNAVVERLIAQARALSIMQIYLEVRQSNEAAQALYRKLHFEIVGQRKGYYTHPKEDAILMKLET